jgi:integrase
VEPLPSGRYRARYTGPDLERHKGPVTFDTRMDAEAWLVAERALVVAGTWTPPAERIAAARAAQEQALTFGLYAEQWWAERTLSPRTRATYRTLLDRFLIPAYGDRRLEAITPVDVRSWYARLGADRPTLRAHTYGLLRTILGQAERDGLLLRNPCHIRGAGNVRRAKGIKPLTIEELAVLAEYMPEHRRAMVLLAAWCALRFGELAELRRSDLDLKDGVVKVRRAVVRVNEDGRVRAFVGAPKSQAGVRDVAIPPHLVPMLKSHLAEHVAPGRDALLFPGADGEHLAPATLYGRAGSPQRVGHGFYAARQAAGRDDLRFHDLRHTGAVLAAQTGATLAELMARLGHSTPQAALRYQHAAAERDRAIAAALSRLATQLAKDSSA